MSLPKSMKAAILVELNEDLLVDEVEMPDSLDFGQVLVEVHYSGICGSQLGEIKGVKGEDKFLPHLLGHEGSGIVKSTGPRVSRFIEGDHVVLHWRPSGGIQSATPNYSLNGSGVNAGSVTTFNEYAIVSENRITKIPNSYPLDQATLYGCAITTGFGVIENNAKIKIGQSLVVVGAGGVGLNIIQAASMRSAFPIIAVDLFRNRLELAENVGATHSVLSAQNSEWVEKIQQILEDDKADVVIDNTGNTEIIRQCYNLSKEQGKTILVGVPHAGDETSIFTLPLHFGKEITGSHGGEATPETDIPRYIGLEKEGIFETSKIITKVFDLDSINEAIKAMNEGTVSGRCIIKMK